MCALVPEQMAPLKRRQESRPHKILGVGYSLLPGTLFIMAALISGGHFPHSPVGEESACNAGDRFDSWVGKIHWRRDRLPTPVFLGFPCGSAGKESACNVRDLGLILGWEESLENRKATHSSILAWKISWTV